MTTRNVNESVVACIDEALRGSVGRRELDATSRHELVDTLLDLRLAVSDVIAVQRLEDGDNNDGPHSRHDRTRPAKGWSLLRS
jgi:hypothetical protein